MYVYLYLHCVGEGGTRVRLAWRETRHNVTGEGYVGANSLDQLLTTSMSTVGWTQKIRNLILPIVMGTNKSDD